MATPRALGLIRRVPTAIGWRLEVRTRGVRERIRRATASLRLRPTYLVVGAQKSGTTSLHAYLRAHPAVLTANTKEAHYFSLAYPRGERWYRSLFPLWTTGAVTRLRSGVRPAVGEATPAYLFDPRAPQRVHAFNPRMKLIAVLRDPIDRAYAHYQWENATRDETRSFEDALAWEETVLAPELDRWFADPTYDSPLPLFGRSYVRRGRYAEQITRWLTRFPREQLHVLTADELLADPAQAMAEIAGFLHVPEWSAPSYPRENVSTYEAMSPVTRERLAATFEPHNRQLEELLGRSLPWTRPGQQADGVLDRRAR